jgi:hypothetical protein
MKKSALLAAAILITLVSGCTVEVKENNPEPKQSSTTTEYVTPTTQYIPPTTQALSMKDAYLQVIYDEYPSLMGNDGLLIEFGYTVCDAIDEGMTLQDLTFIAIDANMDTYTIGYITGAAIMAFCSWNSWFIDQYL